MVGVLIIGYGNQLRGDDAFGAIVALHLQNVLPVEGTQVLTPHQLTPDLAEPISTAGRVVFIDVRDDPDAEPGTVGREILTPTPDPPGAFSHHVSPAALLAYAEMLYGTAPCAALFTVVGRDFEFMHPLSGPVMRALPDVIRAILHWLREV